MRRRRTSDHLKDRFIVNFLSGGVFSAGLTIAQKGREWSFAIAAELLTKPFAKVECNQNQWLVGRTRC
jgi:hypothetical protein